MMASARQRKLHPRNTVEELRKAIAEAMESGRSSAIEIGRAGGVSRMQVYRIRDGENVPALDTAEKMAKHLGMSFRLEPLDAVAATH